MSLHSDIQRWFRRQVPRSWFTTPVDVMLDDDEILVVGTLAEPPAGDDVGEAALDAARDAHVRAFREDTRERRIEIASKAERLFGRKVSWGARCGEAERLFTSLAVPVMTRLRLPERKLLDTLVDGGVARSRSEALAWCVRLVGTHEADWLADLEEALSSVRAVRTEGPVKV